MPSNPPSPLIMSISLYNTLCDLVNKANLKDESHPILSPAYLVQLMVPLFVHGITISRRLQSQSSILSYVNRLMFH